jgi:DNA-binding Lrp family transcriptional regulator
MERRNAGQTAQFDELDARLVTLLADEPRIGVLECARRLAVARGTVQARLDRLQSRGVITGFGPDIAPAALGFVVSAFVTLEIAQGSGRDSVVAHLRGISEVLQVHTVTGQGDLLCRIVAKSNADLQHVIDAVVAHPDIRRTATVISLATPIPYRVLPLVQQAARTAAQLSRGTAPPSAG